jgi:hypothetical protein
MNKGMSSSTEFVNSRTHGTPRWYERGHDVEAYLYCNVGNGEPVVHAVMAILFRLGLVELETGSPLHWEDLYAPISHNGRESRICALLAHDLTQLVACVHEVVRFILGRELLADAVYDENQVCAWRRVAIGDNRHILFFEGGGVECTSGFDDGIECLFGSSTVTTAAPGRGLAMAFPTRRRASRIKPAINVCARRFSAERCPYRLGNVVQRAGPMVSLVNGSRRTFRVGPCRRPQR